MERGEVEGRIGWSWSSLQSSKMEWLKTGKIQLLMQLGLQKHPDIPANIPLVMDLAPTEKAKKALEIVFSRQSMGRPFVMPLGVPAARVAMVRGALMKMVNDPAFRAIAVKQHLEINDPKTEAHFEDVVSEAVSSTVSSFEEEDIHVSHSSMPVVPPVLLNRKQIQQVISNLVRNAVEAPRPRKQLKLAIAMRAPDADTIEVSIADDANGIPDSDHHRIFSRFVSSKKGGSGIGLALCRDIVEAHGGKIWFESTPGVGTTFFFTLRRAD
jgi:hypothetical protein